MTSFSKSSLEGANLTRVDFGAKTDLTYCNLAFAVGEMTNLTPPTARTRTSATRSYLDRTRRCVLCVLWLCCAAVLAVCACLACLLTRKLLLCVPSSSRYTVHEALLCQLNTYRPLSLLPHERQPRRCDPLLHGPYGERFNRCVCAASNKQQHNITFNSTHHHTHSHHSLSLPPSLLCCRRQPPPHPTRRDHRLTYLPVDNLRGANLYAADCSGLDLTGLDLKGTLFGGALFLQVCVCACVRVHAALSFALLCFFFFADLVCLCVLASLLSLSTTHSSRVSTTFVAPY